jgi:tetratricopeptide (TPR) repeat protein
LVYLKMDRWSEAITSYNAALRIEPRLASALYGRGVAKMKQGSVADGKADISAADKIESKIASQFARYGVK